MGMGTPASDQPYNATPSTETVQQAMTLGRVAVGEADIICQDKKYIVVIVRGDAHIYRDMYRIV